MYNIEALMNQQATHTFIIAELSGNHNQHYDQAKAIIREAAEAGADAIKLQTYTPDTITLNSDKEHFQLTQGTIWDGQTLYKLYEKAYTPWEWQPKLKAYAESLGLVCFSSPFDISSVDFLEEMDVPCYKIASFEINDIQLIRYVATKGKPIILSTGVAFEEDIEEAIKTCKEVGNEQIILLKCTSAYPTPLEEVNLKTMADMKQKYNVVVGLSDHTLGGVVPVAAVALGARVVEKHLTLSRANGGVDDAFSMEPHEFKEMVNQIRAVEKVLGKVTYELTEKQLASRTHTRSLFVAKAIKRGELFTHEHIKSVRPGNGISTKYYDDIIGKVASQDIEMGTPMCWDYLVGEKRI